MLDRLRVVRARSVPLSQLRDYVRAMDYRATKKRLHVLAEVLDAIGEHLAAFDEDERAEWAAFARWVAREVGGFDG
ncbi:MAG: hypothetical protein KGI89_17285 [Euryarchaeota archaeon]|nr:hypothetical protein [Euryarchaeota archaeon]